MPEEGTAWRAGDGHTAFEPRGPFNWRRRKFSAAAKLKTKNTTRAIVEDNAKGDTYWLWTRQTKARMRIGSMQTFVQWRATWRAGSLALVGDVVSTCRLIRGGAAHAHQHGGRVSAVDACDGARPIVPYLQKETAPAGLSAIPRAIPAREACFNVVEAELFGARNDDHAVIRIDANDGRARRLDSLKDQPRFVARRSAGAGGGAQKRQC